MIPMFYISVISCGHTFCEDCIEGWKKKQPNTTCPICRSEIILTSPNQVMDSFIEKFVDNFFPDDAKKARVELIADRKAKKESREAKRAREPMEPILSTGTRRRILNLSDDNDNDSDSDFLGLPDLDLESPSRFVCLSILLFLRVFLTILFRPSVITWSLQTCYLGEITLSKAEVGDMSN